MSATGTGVERVLRHRIDRTAIQASFPVTCVAKVNLFLNGGNIQFKVAQQCPLDRHAKGRNSGCIRIPSGEALQTFSANGPLLKWLPGFVGRIDGA